MESINHKVVIIGHGFTSRLAVIRSVAQIGCEVTVIVMAWYKRQGVLDTTKPIDCYSKYINKIYYCYAKDYEGIIDILLTKCIDSNQKVVIIPGNDVSAAIIDANQERLNEFFLFPHIHHTPGFVEKWMDKVRQKELAQRQGLEVPSSHIVKIKSHCYKLPANITYPCFTKPLVTLVGGKKFFKKCDDESSLRDVLEIAGSNEDVKVLVEDFKQIDTEYALLGFSDGNDVIIPGILEILSLAHGGHFGVACQGRVLPVTGFENLISKFKLLVLEIGFVGVFDIDFYRSGNDFYFGELNLRIGGSCYAVTKMGVNLPAMMVRYFYGEDISTMKKNVIGSATFVNERMCMDDWYDGFISTREYQSLLNNSDISFVKDSEDSEPYKVYLREYRMKYMKRIVKHIIGRTKFDKSR